MRSIFICTLFLLLGIMPVAAQKYQTKPYLEVYNTISNKVYRIKPNKVMYVKRTTDIDYTRTKIKKFLNDSTMILKGMDTVSLGQIEVLCFASEVPRRTFEQISYASFYYLLVHMYVYDMVYAGYDPGLPAFAPIIFVLLQPIWIVGTELMSVIIKANTPSMYFYKDKNLKLNIVR